MERVAFSHDIIPTPVSALYRLSLAVVAAAMLLLPAIYVALIAGTVWFVDRYLTSMGPALLPGTGLSWIHVLLYLGPPFAGSVLAFFLIKPVLAPRADRHAPVLLERDQAPGLFALIELICGQLRAPIPRRVQVDCSVNASASFLPGPLSIVRGDLVLTVGLPVAAGLSHRDLAGVLAHEFGHFTQGGAMRLTWMIRKVNTWLFRVVYERDKWDREFENWHAASNVHFGMFLVVLLTRGCVWVSRLALSGLLRVGHTISCFMMRQMEYDADNFEIKVSGSASFASTMTRFRVLIAGTALAYRELSETPVLPENLPRFIVDASQRLPDDVLQMARRTPDTPTRAVDTHPSDADRLRAAEQAADAGAIVGGDESAVSLFHDFDAISALATRHHYEHNLQLQVDPQSLVAGQDVIRERDQRREWVNAIGRFFGECVSPYRPFRLSLADLDGQPSSAIRATLNQAREAMGVPHRNGYVAHRHYEWLADRAAKAFCAEELWLAGLLVPNPDQFDLATGTLDDARATQAWAHDEQQKLVPALDRFNEAASRRLTCALCLLPPDDGAGNVRALADALNALTRALPHAFEISRFVSAQTAIRGPNPNVPPSSLMSARLAKLDSALATSIAKVYESLGDVRHSLPSDEAPGTLAAWCGFASDVLTVDASLVPHRIVRLYWTTLARLVMLAERAEADPPA